MLSLPVPTKAIPSLNDDVYDRLRRKYAGVLPSRPLDQPNNDCRTCNGRLQFRWFVNLADSIVPERREIPKVGRPGEVDIAYEIPTVPPVDDYQCECWRQARLQAYLVAHGMGKNAARATWSDTAWVPEHLRLSLHEYADNCTDWSSRGMGLYLFSPLWGSGKSLVALMILKAFLAQGIEGHWITFN